MCDEPARRKFTAQFSLRTLLLLTAAVAVWIGIFVTRRETQRLNIDAQQLRPLARELFVDDPQQIAVIKRLEEWYDENIWDLHLPQAMRLCVASREIDDKGTPPIMKEVAIPAGRRAVEIRSDRLPDKSWRTIVLLDGAEVLAVDEPADWNAGRGSSGGGAFSTSTQLPANKTVELFRRRFMVETSPGISNSPNGPANGLMLWLEPVE